VQRATSIVSLLLALAGCAGNPVAPVGTDHPANPDAAAAPSFARPTTLDLQAERATADASPAAAAAGPVTYACPMHPKVTSNAPGNCPECGMALKPVRPRPAAQPAAPANPQPSDPAHADHPSAHDHGAHDHGGHQ
jgi:hypothetical protein